ncbi:site-2 protease family protein [Kibdelosporangium aridum]|uniref:Zinc metalloprotease n=1 Tax=Kibdelosporangium aridum TaxID=2030 RepID=A0A428ZAW8_KIBAR|nr:site-2 protease family protein [Kibdelosporangium aridum]RSM85204.1 site-2 protease family protein [Kibdelosporangium aridum]
MFKSSIPLGRIAGVPVGAHWSVLVIMVLLTELLAIRVLAPAVPGQPAWVYWAVAAGTAVTFMASLLAHEVTHALVGRHFRLRTKRITLWLLGGAAEFDAEPPTPKADALVALSGPLTSLVLGGVCYGLAEVAARLGFSWLLVTALAWLAFTNGVLAAFNLLPATPLDGGRVLRAVVWKRTGDREHGVSAAARSGRFVGGGLVVLGVLPMLYGRFDLLLMAFVGWFIMTAASTESVPGQLSGLRVADVMTPDPVVAPGWWTVHAFLDRVAANSPHRVFPVVSFEGKATGLVSLGELTRVPPDARSRTRIDKACRQLAAAPSAHPDDRLDKVAFGASPRLGRDLILVVLDERVVGVISPNDIARAIELRALDQPVRRNIPG